MTEGSANNPWAWLGLLKWSLAYSDGTRDEQPSPMSEEDRAFLEKVMKEGIIDENERMKTILREVTDMMTKWREQTWNTDEEENINQLLEELRDIVEQIDFARSFAAMKGLEFLLGCVQERKCIPKSTRSLCLGIIATLSCNNPPVQKQLLELGALKTLSELFFVEQDSRDDDDADGKMRARTMQSIGAIVRSDVMGETIFTQLHQSADLIMNGLGMGEKEYSATPQVVRQRTLFLLRALATSDHATAESMEPFRAAIAWAVQYPVDDAMEASTEIREMALAMLHQILEKGQVVLFNTSSNNSNNKDSLTALGVRRIAALRALEGEDREFASMELELWETILGLLAQNDSISETSASSN
ncbi:hypothetical protein ACA910_021747 [Epithemia clementina (nom. ined.)]